MRLRFDDEVQDKLDANVLQSCLFLTLVRHARNRFEGVTGARDEGTKAGGCNSRYLSALLHSGRDIRLPNDHDTYASVL